MYYLLCQFTFIGVNKSIQYKQVYIHFENMIQKSRYVHLLFVLFLQITTTSFLYSSCMYRPWRAPSKACLEWADYQWVSHQFQELQISSLSGPLCSLSAQADWHGRDLKEAIFQKVQIPCSDWVFWHFFFGWCVFKMVESNFWWDGSCFFCWKDSKPASKEKKFILFFNPTEHWKNTSFVQRYLHW